MHSNRTILTWRSTDEVERVRPKPNQGEYYVKFSQDRYDERLAVLEERGKLRKIDRYLQEAVKEYKFLFDESAVRDCSTNMVLRDHQEFQRWCLPLTQVLARRAGPSASSSSSNMRMAGSSNASAPQRPVPAFAAPAAPLAFRPQHQPGHHAPGVPPPAPLATEPKPQKKARAPGGLPAGRKGPYPKTSPRKQQLPTPPNSWENRPLPSFDVGNQASGQYNMAQNAMSPIPGSAFASPVIANATPASAMGTNANVPPQIQIPGLNMVNGNPTPPTSGNTNADTAMSGWGIGFDNLPWGPLVDEVDPLVISPDDIQVSDDLGLFDGINIGTYTPVAAPAAPAEPSFEELQARLEAAEQRLRDSQAEQGRVFEERLRREAEQEEMLRQQFELSVMGQYFDFDAVSAPEPEVDMSNPMDVLYARTYSTI